MTDNGNDENVEDTGQYYNTEYGGLRGGRPDQGSNGCLWMMIIPVVIVLVLYLYGELTGMQFNAP